MRKRRHGRVQTQGVAGHVQQGASLVPGMTVENLSMGGAFIRTADPFPQGTAVLVELVRPGLKKALQCAGRVVMVMGRSEAQAHRRFPGMGIAFDPLDAETSERLQELLRALAPPDGVLTGDEPLPSAPGPSLASTEGQVGLPPGIAVEAGRLKVQVTGLLMELSDAREEAARLVREVERLERENQQLRERLAAR